MSDPSPGRPTRVSVLIPCFNYGRFVHEAVLSLDGQDRRPDEVIICDDASADDSWVVISRLVAERENYRAIRHEQNRGMVSTFNELVGLSTGDIIVPLSADDRLSATFLRRIEEEMEANDWDFGYPSCQTFGAESAWFEAPELDVDRLVRENYISATSGIRRSVFEEVGGYSPEFDKLGFEDYEFWLRVIGAGKVGGKVSGCHLEWRRHPGGSRNTADLRKRVTLRWKLIRTHPRFFLHRRSVRYAARLIRKGVLGQ